MPPTQYWAHSSQSEKSSLDPYAGWQPLSVHLEAVARLSKQLALTAKPKDELLARMAEVAGLFHDLGKYMEAFQRMLLTGRGHPQHAIHGAMLAYFGVQGAARRPALEPVAAVIAGHHAGLADRSSLKEKLLNPAYQCEAQGLVTEATEDCEPLHHALSDLDGSQNVSELMRCGSMDLTTRMLFSCLVDADRLDTAGRSAKQESLRADERLKALLAHIENLKQRAGTTAKDVMAARAAVLQDCLDAAAWPHRLFSLSVPTGGGKTLSAMAFALRRAALFPERFRRVIVVIPYLSIIEQNASVYADIFSKDALLEHHSGSIQKLTRGDENHFMPTRDAEGDDEKQFQETGLRPEVENWDAPLIVTTSVRFFESLFSNHPADLRRVHNIARSIVILDEVQTLPRRLLGPLLGMMEELAEDWDTNFVFSTATQPAFERPSHKKDLRWEPGTLTEIIRQPDELRRNLKRVELQWEIKSPIRWSEVAERMFAEQQCMTIVNLREHAVTLYKELLKAAAADGLDRDGIFHLSTRMCAAHRLRVLKIIRDRLGNGEACRMVSTQLVEAGVDVDFPLVLRALGPLDSIIQAAGRADREGKRTAEIGRPGGKVVVFRPQEHKLPPNEYTEATGVTEALIGEALESGESIQVDSTEAIQTYFERYYGASGIDLGEQLIEHRAHRNFATLAEQFEMISSRAQDVLVPDDEEAKRAIEELRSLSQTHEFDPEKRLATGLRLRELRRELQRHTVGLSPSEFKRAEGVLESLSLPTGDEIWVAVDHGYDEQLGLTFETGPAVLVL